MRQANAAPVGRERCRLTEFDQWSSVDASYGDAGVLDQLVVACVAAMGGPDAAKGQDDRYGFGALLFLIT